MIETLEPRVFLSHTLLPQLPLPTSIGQEFVIEDWDNDVTQTDFGLNYTSGEFGSLGDTIRELADASSSPVGDSLRIIPGTTTFEGIFTFLMGREKIEGDTLVPAMFLNLDDIYGGFGPLAGRDAEQLRFDVQHAKGSDLVMTVELKDEYGQAVSAPVIIPDTGGTWDTVSVNLDSLSSAGFDRTKVTLITLLVGSGESPFLIDNLRIADTDGTYPDFMAMANPDGTLKPAFESGFLDYVRQTSAAYFIDFASRFAGAGAKVAENIGGLIQDDAAAPDQLTIGGVGFQLTSYVIDAERGYFDPNTAVGRAEAAKRVRGILEVLANHPQGTASSGTIGHEGFFYHFLGPDGLRKGGSELSTVDTALAIAGVVTVGQYFDGNTVDEMQIRTLANDIYSRVNWHFMRNTNATEQDQFFLAWRPESTSGFQFANPSGPGFYSGSSTDPATLDYYTDEGLLVALLAMGSPNPAHRLGREVWDAIERDTDGGAFVKSFPGSLFTYQFASAWLDTDALGPDNHSDSVDWFENTREAILTTRAYAMSNSTNRATWLDGKGATRWGLSAARGPVEYLIDGLDYFPDAARTAALNINANDPLEVGTVTAYGAGSAIVHTPDLALAALWAMAQDDLNQDGTPDLLHPRLGFVDAFNLDIADTADRGAIKLSTIVRPGSNGPEGPWANHTGFAINHGPMLILIDNHLSNQFIPRLFMSHPQIAAALATLFPAAADMVVDNSEATLVGSWTPSMSVSGFYDENYLHDGNAGKGAKSATFAPDLPLVGTYEVYARWTSDANRASNVPFDIYHAGGVTTVTKDQRQNGGEWVRLGTFEFDGTGGKVVIRTSGTNGYVISDAVRFVRPNLPTVVILDNADAIRTGTWSSSTARSGFFGDDYLHDGNTGKGSKSLRWETSLTGTYAVYTRWTSDTNRASNAPYDIAHAGGLTTVLKNQKVGGGTWQLLGTFSFNGTAAVTLRNGGTDGYVIGDAVEFQKVISEYIIDNTAATLTGTWIESTSVPGFFASNYLHDGNIGKGSKSVQWTPDLLETATYQVYARWTSNPNRATNARYDITHAGGTSSVLMNQRLNGGTWVLLGTFSFNAGTTGTITLRNDEADGYVVADAVRLVQVE